MDDPEMVEWLWKHVSHVHPDCVERANVDWEFEFDFLKLNLEQLKELNAEIDRKMAE